MHDAVGRFRAPPGVWVEVLLFSRRSSSHRQGMLGRAPPWLNLALMVVGASLGLESVHRWLAGGDLRRL
jgi:hypothetical protein